MTIFDVAGLSGVGLMLLGYGLTVSRHLAIDHPFALAMNLVGAALVLLSLWHDFNLSAALMEGAWALIALAGLIRHVWRRHDIVRPEGDPSD